MAVIVRDEQPQDARAVRAVNLAAFATAAEADLVDVLRWQARPVVSLVAEEGGEVVGHIMFTPVTLVGQPQLRIMGLAPMAITPAHQRKGIGSVLVRAGLERCRALGAGAIVVLGHPTYYPRFGFEPAVRFGIGSEYDAPPDAFMLLELQPGHMHGTSGTVAFHAAFNGTPPADDHLTEHRLSTELIHDGLFFSLHRDRVRMPNGAEALREYIVHPGAVMMVPIADDGRLVMERQFRYPMHRVMLEFPAGKLDRGEAPFDCAVRELAEETGYTAREWARAGVLHNAIAYSTEGIEVWFARGLIAGSERLDAGEHLDVVLLTEAELERAARDGAVTDAKTLTGLLWLQNWRAGRWPLRWHDPP